MTSPPGHLTSRLVMSAWVEVGHVTPLRVNITEVAWPDGEDRVVTVASIDDACDEIRGWLERLLGRVRKGP